MGTVVLSRVKNGRGVKLTAYLQQEDWLRKGGTVEAFLPKCLHGVARHKFILYSRISLVLFTVYVGTSARHVTAKRTLQMCFVKPIID